MFYFKKCQVVHLGEEAVLADPMVIKLLFNEMTFAVQYGLYPCDVEDAAMLAAVHLHITHGPGATKDAVL